MGGGLVEPLRELVAGLYGAERVPAGQVAEDARLLAALIMVVLPDLLALRREGWGELRVRFERGLPVGSDFTLSRLLTPVSRRALSGREE
jgi:hypothetical protein